jgi:vacuolar-type H+-ATPase subunit I/STV1
MDSGEAILTIQEKYNECIHLLAEVRKRRQAALAAADNALTAEKQLLEILESCKTVASKNGFVLSERAQ